MDLRIRLKEVRENKGLSQQALASAIGESQSTLASWENGKSMPRANTLLKLVNYLDVSLDYLCGRSELKEIITNDNIELSLSDKEKKLILGYRKLAEAQQEMVDRQLVL